jgi:hypothetical protein
MIAKLSVLLSIAALLAVTGCSSIKSALTPSLVESSVAASTKYGLAKYPAATPAVRVATEAICAAGNQTNLAPANIVATIEASEYANLKTPEATFIVQAGVTLYSVAYNSWGADAVNNSDQAREYLMAVCSGLHAGLPISGLRFTAPADLKWPQLK